MDWLMNPRDPRVQASLAWSCDVCKARVKHLCTNTIHADKPLPGRVVHFARLVERRVKKGTL